MTPFISNLFNFPVTKKEVLKRAKNTDRCGLCFAIRDSLREYKLSHLCYRYESIFPLFRPHYALYFGASKTMGYWWSAGEWDSGRMDFLNWLIEQYKDDKTNLRKL